MDEYLTLENLLKIYEEEIRKNVKNKKKLYYFEKNKMSILTEIYEELKSGKFSKLKYNIFYIQEPKYRVVMSLNIKDKIINHFATRYILMPKLEKYLDMRNVATRKNMGSDYGIKLIKKYMNQLKNKNFYILKLDISKYFYSIDHDVLKSLIIKDLNEEEYRLICHIIDSSNEDYVYESIQKIQQKGIDVPNYERKKGLPIGNMTSQFLSVFFLHKLDHYIVHDLTISRYVKYMDDMILMHEDKEYLKFCLEKIEYKLKQEYQLKLNSKKTKIISCKEGFGFS